MMMVVRSSFRPILVTLAIFERNQPSLSELFLLMLVSNLVIKFGADVRSNIVLSDLVKVLFGLLPRHMLPIKIVEDLDALPSVPLGVQ